MLTKNSPLDLRNEGGLEFSVGVQCGGFFAPEQRPLVAKLAQDQSDDLSHVHAADHLLKSVECGNKINIIKCFTLKLLDHTIIYLL